MEIQDKKALWIPSLEFIFSLCSDGSERGLSVDEIESLVTAFCVEELPPNYDHQGISEDLFFNCLRYSSHKAFLVDSDSSKKLQEDMVINLDCVRARDYDPIDVYCHLVQRINGRKHDKRIYFNGRNFTSGAQEKRENDSMPEVLKTGNSSRTSTNPIANLSTTSKVSLAGQENQEHRHGAQLEAAFAWKDVAFNIDIKACSSTKVDQIWVLFNETIDSRFKSRPYTEEDFDVGLLKAAIAKDPDTSDIDLIDKYLWQEDLQKSFRFVQSDMLVLLKAFLADGNLHKPRPWIHVKLLRRNMNKRPRNSTAEAENEMEVESAPKKRNSGRHEPYTSEEIAELLDDSADETSEPEAYDIDFVPPVSSRTRGGTKRRR